MRNESLLTIGLSLKERQEIQPDEIDKYTVVIWLEGDDPNCKDDILGGHVEMTMRFMY